MLLAGKTAQHSALRPTTYWAVDRWFIYVQDEEEWFNDPKVEILAWTIQVFGSTYLNPIMESEQSSLPFVVSNYLETFGGNNVLVGCLPHRGYRRR